MGDILQLVKYCTPNKSILLTNTYKTKSICIIQNTGQVLYSFMLNKLCVKTSSGITKAKQTTKKQTNKTNIWQQSIVVNMYLRFSILLHYARVSY